MEFVQVRNLLAADGTAEYKNKHITSRLIAAAATEWPSSKPSRKVNVLNDFGRDILECLVFSSEVPLGSLAGRDYHFDKGVCSH